MRSLLAFFSLAVGLTLISGCSSDDGPAPPATGILRGTVTDLSSGQVLPDARVVVSDAGSNIPLGALTTGADGTYGAEIPPGSYTVKVSRQGYDPAPPRDIAPYPVTVMAGQTTGFSVQMTPSSVVGGGAIAGRVTNATTGVAGVLVVAESGLTGYSTLTDGNGNYWIFNVPPDSYTVKAQAAHMVSSSVSVTVPATSQVSNVNITVSPTATGAVSGHVTFLATTNVEVDVTLLNQKSGEPVPGLTAPTVGMFFVIPSVPPGTYLARASYNNDGKVMDPDWIVKNGQPIVTVGSDTVDRDFSLTGAVEVLAPTNPASLTQPVPVQGTRPVFSWSPYSSADDYVIEVSDQNGRVLWGGFENNWTVRKVVIPRTNTSIEYDVDSTATEALQVGRVYRWRVYASKDDTREPTGWKLISVSEEQRGLIHIVE